MVPTFVLQRLGLMGVQYRRLMGRRQRINISAGVNLITIGSPDSHTFFGYYDISPFDRHERRVVTLQVPLHATACRSSARICIVDLGGGERELRPISETKAWCWQQGSRLRWMPQDDALFTNGHDAERHCGWILDATTGDRLYRVARPLYDISSDGRFGLSLNFSRLQRLRPGYGYGDRPDPTANCLAPDEDGVWLVDIETSKERLLFSLADAANLDVVPSMVGATHYFNHLSWNPSGDRFMVFHIWEKPGERRRLRVLTAGHDGRPRVITDGEHVSHYCWLDDSRLLFFSTPLGHPMGYYIYEDNSTTAPIDTLRGSMPDGDGHPSLDPTGRWLVTDSLPDRFSERSVYLFNWDKRRLVRCVDFFSPLAFSGEYRCDLHPRWSPSGCHIAVDSAHSGFRQMVILDVGNVMGMGAAS